MSIRRVRQYAPVTKTAQIFAPDSRPAVALLLLMCRDEPQARCAPGARTANVCRLSGLLAPPGVADTGLAPNATATSGTVAQIENSPQPPKKKRGCRSRIFGTGKDDEPDKQDEQNSTKKKSGG